MAGTGIVTKLVAGVLVLGGAIAIIATCAGPPEAPPTAATSRAAPSKDDAMYSRLQGLWVVVRARAKDPSSVEFVDAGYTDAGAVALTFRARNSFNALTTGRAVLAPDGVIAAGSDADVAVAWNRHVAGKALRPLPRP